MNTSEIRQRFLHFFQQKDHTVVSSAPVVLKNDPTLMFTNAGMNQFKDRFLGYQNDGDPRIADVQKCLRVSGKHNDLEEVGVDHYHHTLFEMLGNWSFGDYFKKEAIQWAYAFFVEELKLPQERLYATYFEGDTGDGLAPDAETLEVLQKLFPETHILPGSKKDNFWEMGDTGPCGPACELHIDLRDGDEQKEVSGRALVNQDHEQVIELWNLVFMQFNRKTDGSLEPLPERHVDTGMGLERLVRVLQGKKSNYDTDIFRAIIGETEKLSGRSYQGGPEKCDVAFRVIADHIRAVAFAIADGQLPANIGAGYVIRRILRRAIRFGYSFLGIHEPFMHNLVDVLVREMGEHYTELPRNREMITQVIHEEEQSFYRTLEKGLARLRELTGADTGQLDGKAAFELYDTFGFPIDLTRLILEEKGWSLDETEFEKELQEQKNRSRKAGKLMMGDWVVVHPDREVQFTGYDELERTTELLQYRQVSDGKKSFHQLVLAETPFYPEGGGQVGDRGVLRLADGMELRISDTRRENELIVHTTYDPMPVQEVMRDKLVAKVNEEARMSTARNHSATHLLHHALREVLGKHVEQKGSLVHPDYLRFDFSHFRAMDPGEIEQVETRVNEMVLQGMALDEYRDIPVDEALQRGALALFGEKYGDVVRMIQFGSSRELCGGTHVPNTAFIGPAFITNETGVASGVRRIEMLTGSAALGWARNQRDRLTQVAALVKNPKDPVKALEKNLEQRAALEAELEGLKKQMAIQAANDLLKQAEALGGIRFLGVKTGLPADAIKDMCFAWRKKEEALVAIVGTEKAGKASLSVMVTDDLVKQGIKAGDIVKQISSHIRGGGGGQPFFATAGGKNPQGISAAIDEGKNWLSDLVMG